MLFDWSAECSADDPVLVVPWKDPAGSAQFIDLRENPYGLDEIEEAEAHPALRDSLRALNALRSPLFTAKCDLWAASAEELRALVLTLGLQPEECVAGTVSYIDMVCRDRAMFTSFHQQQHLLHRMERRVAALEQSFALAEAIVRPCLLDLTAPQEGFAVSLYVKAVGPDAELAYAVWAETLRAVTAILRAKDLIPQT